MTPKLRKLVLTELETDELRLIDTAGPTLPPITSPAPPSMPVTGCVSRLHDESICACVSTGGTTR